MTAHETFLKTRFFGSLDGLRFVSIAAVVWHHTASPSFHWSLFGQGYHGVTLFFAISGFLITTLLLREKAKNGKISLRKFYLRRSLRIFPLYYAVLLLYCVVVKLVEKGSPVGQEFFHNLRYYLTYTSNWFVTLGDGRVIFFFAWSLATEEQFYLVWPSVESRLGGWAPVWVALATVLVSKLVAFGLFASAPVLLVRMVTSVSTAICLGVVLAHLLHDKKTYTMLHRVFGHRMSAPATLVVAACALAVAGTLGPAGRLLVEVSFVCLVASCVVREDHGLAAVLTWRPFAWVGTISYGVYLLHMLSANIVKKALPGVVHATALGYFVLALLVGIAVAAVSFRYYESVFLGLKKRFEA